MDGMDIIEYYEQLSTEVKCMRVTNLNFRNLYDRQEYLEGENRQ